MNQLDQEQMQPHVTILGWLLIAGHAIFLLVGMCGFLLLTGIGAASGDSQALAILGVIGTIGGLFFAALAIPAL